MSNSNDKFPEKIYVSGNPILLRGFNGKYRYYKNPQTGLVEYHQGIHILRIGYSHLSVDIAIRPTKIFQKEKDQRWVLTTNDCTGDDLWKIHVKRRVGDHTPLGDWGDILVTDREDFGTWWRSNGQYIVNTFIFLGILMSIVWAVFLR